MYDTLQEKSRFPPPSDRIRLAVHEHLLLGWPGFRFSHGFHEHRILQLQTLGPVAAADTGGDAGHAATVSVRLLARPRWHGGCL